MDVYGEQLGIHYVFYWKNHQQYRSTLVLDGFRGSSTTQKRVVWGGGTANESPVLLVF